jgi:hypothetical protein
MRRFLFLGVILFLFGFAEHKYYVSNTIIEMNSRSNLIEVTSKIFTDDLERALGSTDENPLRIGDEKESISVNSLIENYLRKNLKIKFDGHEVNMMWVGKEVEGEMVYVYFQVSDANNFSVAEVSNSSLFELFPGQINRVDLRFNGWTKTLQLSKEYPKDLVYK